jgi:MIP family channel proteins
VGSVHDTRRYLAEFAGTYLLVIVGPGTIIVLSLASISGTTALCLVAVAFGGIVTLDILLFSSQSGAIVNPALTLATASARVIDLRLVVPYVVFQGFGGVLAGLTLRLVFGSLGETTSLGSTKLASNITPVAGFLIEAVGTFALASAAIIASTRMKKTWHQAFFVGFTLGVLILLIGPLTGAGFNPARSIGPSLAAGYFVNLPVYILGPIAGALASGLSVRAARTVN